MPQKQRVKSEAPIPKRKRARMSRRRKANPLAAQAQSKKHPFPLQTMKISDFYRPLKKPVTIRIDADVLAWFQKDGNRYQTRINLALRKVMEREMKAH